MKKSLVGIMIVGLLVLGVFAQRWYGQKPYTDWSAKEAQRVLTKSPWVDSHIQASSTDAGITRAAQMSGGVPRGGGSPDTESRTILRGYWYSARPARMAIANTALRNNPELDRTQLDEFAKAQMPDAVLALTIETSSRRSQQAFFNALREWTLEEIREVTRLSTKSGKELEPSDYRPPDEDGTGAKFIFPRNLPDGRPLLEASDGEARFETRFRLGQDQVRIRFRYKLKNMLYQDRLEY